MSDEMNKTINSCVYNYDLSTISLLKGPDLKSISMKVLLLNLIY